MGFAAAPRRRSKPRSSHFRGRSVLPPGSHACRPVPDAATIVTWRFAILPKAPQYAHAAPTGALPGLPRLFPSKVKVTLRWATNARRRVHNVPARHRPCVMQC